MSGRQSSYVQSSNNTYYTLVHRDNYCALLILKKSACRLADAMPKIPVCSAFTIIISWFHWQDLNTPQYLNIASKDLDFISTIEPYNGGTSTVKPATIVPLTNRHIHDRPSLHSRLDQLLWPDTLAIQLAGKPCRPFHVSMWSVASGYLLTSKTCSCHCV